MVSLPSVAMVTVLLPAWPPSSLTTTNLASGLSFIKAVARVMVLVAEVSVTPMITCRPLKVTATAVVSRRHANGL